MTATLQRVTMKQEILSHEMSFFCTHPKKIKQVREHYNVLLMQWQLFHQESSRKVFWKAAQQPMVSEGPILGSYHAATLIVELVLKINYKKKHDKTDQLLHPSTRLTMQAVAILTLFFLTYHCLVPGKNILCGHWLC